ncbi:MAG: hypothetical protein KME04_13300 [Pleurocapsa minor GSE-CHR-MK-17-07R]|nr:hypothetical protein [Pleurocapsa minor GSE-CHR-MK 17-07R]
MNNIHYKTLIDDVPITLVSVEGALNDRLSRQLVDVVRMLVSRGDRNLIFDMHKVTAINGSGLLALVQAALLIRGEWVADNLWSWHTFHHMEQMIEMGTGSELRILSPSVSIMAAFIRADFTRAVDIFLTLHEAASSYRNPATTQLIQQVSQF